MYYKKNTGLLFFTNKGKITNSRTVGTSKVMFEPNQYTATQKKGYQKFDNAAQQYKSKYYTTSNKQSMKCKKYQYIQQNAWIHMFVSK